MLFAVESTVEGVNCSELERTGELVEVAVGFQAEGPARRKGGSCRIEERGRLGDVPVLIPPVVDARFGASCRLGLGLGLGQLQSSAVRRGGSQGRQGHQSRKAHEERRASEGRHGVVVFWYACSQLSDFVVSLYPFSLPRSPLSLFLALFFLFPSPLACLDANLLSLEGAFGSALGREDVENELMHMSPPTLMGVAAFPRRVVGSELCCAVQGLPLQL